MRKHLLIPLDGSRLAEMIIPYAVAYARAHDYSLTLLNVAVPTTASTASWILTPAGEKWESREDEPDSGKQYLRAVANRLQALGLQVFTQVTQDEPANSIIAYAENHPDVAVIAMSTHGRSGIGRLVFGSVAEQVLHSSPVPVLLIRPIQKQDIFSDFNVPEYTSIVVPLDGSDFAAHALTHATMLAHAFDAHITLVCAASEAPLALELNTIAEIPKEWTPERETQFAYLQQVTHQLESEGLHVQSILEYGPPAEAILRVARSTQADIIVMSTHGRTGISRFWLGSVASKLVHDATCPLLLIRTKERVKEPELQKKLVTARVISGAM